LSVSTNATTIGWLSLSDDVILTSPYTSTTDVLSDQYGSYTIKVAVELNGCTNHDQTTVHFYEQPQKPNAGPDQVLHLTGIAQVDGEYIGP